MSLEEAHILLEEFKFVNDYKYLAKKSGEELRVKMVYDLEDKVVKYRDLRNGEFVSDEIAIKIMSDHYLEIQRD